MTATPNFVFKAIKPERIKAAAADREVEAEQFHDLLQAFESGLVGRKAHGYGLFGGGYQVTGYKMRDVDDLLPGWRTGSQRLTAMPDKFTVEGRELKERVSRILMPEIVIPGAPILTGSPGKMHPPRLTEVEAVGEECFILLPEDTVDAYLAMIDSSLWHLVSHQEYLDAKSAAGEAS